VRSVGASVVLACTADEGGDDVLAVVAAGGITAFEPSTGRVLWSLPGALPAASQASVSRVGAVLFVAGVTPGESAAALLRIDLHSGELLSSATSLRGAPAGAFIAATADASLYLSASGTELCEIRHAGSASVACQAVDAAGAMWLHAGGHSAFVQTLSLLLMVDTRTTPSTVTQQGRALAAVSAAGDLHAIARLPASPVRRLTAVITAPAAACQERE